MKLKDKIVIIISVLVIVLIALLSIEYKDELYEFYDKTFNKKDIEIINNEYHKDSDYLYVKNTNDFYAKDEKHLYDIIYTILNSGNDSFTFYCSKEYSNCISDVKKLANDQVALSNINNYVHPFNSFKRISVTYTENGKITIDVNKNYSKDEINKLNEKIDSIIEENIIETMDDERKIRVIHDYIINNSNYTKDEDLNNDANNKATGNLLNGYGLCSGYADSMALFLNKMGIDNYKIASDTHIWNLVYVNDNWLHLDLTWDDPVVSDGKDRLEILFFLINDNRLNEIKVDQHDYDKNVYLEIKK